MAFQAKPVYLPTTLANMQYYIESRISHQSPLSDGSIGVCAMTSAGHLIGSILLDVSRVLILRVPIKQSANVS